MKRLLRWALVLALCLGFGVFFTEDAQAADKITVSDGSMENPILTGERSIEKYFFDTYTSQGDIAKLYNGVYKKYAKKYGRKEEDGSTSEAVWYFRLGDTSNLESTELSKYDSDPDSSLTKNNPLYVVWISYLKRSSDGKQGTLSECTMPATKPYYEQKRVYGRYHTYGFGIKIARTEENAFSGSGYLGAGEDAFIWYGEDTGVASYAWPYATMTESTTMGNFWVYAKSGQWGYCVYYIKYSELIKRANAYNESKNCEQKLTKIPPDSTSSNKYDKKYWHYNFYLNGSTATGDYANARTFATNKSYLNGLRSGLWESYCEENYNKWVPLYLMNNIPIVVRAWDITTNTIVSRTVAGDTDYYLSAYDGALDGVEGVYWDTDSADHTTDIQHAIIKFLYEDVTTESGTSSRAKVVVDDEKNKYWPIDKYVNKAKKNESAYDGKATLFFEKDSKMTTTKEATTADAYALTGFRIFAYTENESESVTENLATLRKKKYLTNNLKKYDPVTGEDREKGNFQYARGSVKDYCYKVDDLDGLRVLNFDVRKDVKGEDGSTKSRNTKVDWPDDLKFDFTGDGHSDRTSVKASKFFSYYALTTKTTKASEDENESLLVAKDKYRKVSSTVSNSIRTVARTLGASNSTFEIKGEGNLEDDDAACIVVDILVTEMYYDQDTYNIEQLKVMDNKYDDERGVWGYQGEDTVATGTTELADGAIATTTKSVSSYVHSESDDKEDGDRVELIKSVNQKSDGYLRLGITKYGRVVEDEASGVIYTLEGWSHYTSPSSDSATDANAGYMDSLDTKYAGYKIAENSFALYSTKWYEQLDSFGDMDDDASDGKLSAKLSEQNELVADAWSYNLFYVVKPPLLGMVYVYNAEEQEYEVKYVSARSCTSFGASNTTEAKKKAVDNQLKSTGVSGKNGNDVTTAFIVYDAGYHRAGDRIDVTVCGNWEYTCTKYKDSEGKVWTKGSVQNLSKVYTTRAMVDYYDSSSNLPEEGATVKAEAGDYSNLFGYADGTERWSAPKGTIVAKTWTKRTVANTPTKLANQTFNMEMPETTTVIVAVYGGKPDPVPTNFKMRVQFIQEQEDGSYEQAGDVVELSYEGNEDYYYAKVDWNKALEDAGLSDAISVKKISDVGERTFKVSNTALPDHYDTLPGTKLGVTWKRSQDREYKLIKNENKKVIYAKLPYEPPEDQWATVVYLNAGEISLKDGESTTATFTYLNAQPIEGDPAFANLARTEAAYVGTAYGKTVRQINYTTITASTEGLLQSATATITNRGGTFYASNPKPSKDPRGASISWSKSGKNYYNYDDTKGGLVIYVLQYTGKPIDSSDSRIDETETMTVTPLQAHTIDWERAKAATDGSGNLSAASYNLDVSEDADEQRVYLANDEVNSTRSMYDPLLSIPTSEFVKQYAKVKKYECEWQYEKVTITWNFEYTVTTYHYATDEHGSCAGTHKRWVPNLVLVGYDKKGNEIYVDRGHWETYSMCGHGDCSCSTSYHRYSGKTKVTTTGHATRYTTYYRVKFADTFVPTDITTFNESFGTFGTGIYNKTLDRMGHATMLAKHNSYQNAALGFHQVSASVVKRPAIDYSALYTNDTEPHHTCYSCCNSLHRSYCAWGKENQAAVDASLSAAVGSVDEYRSSNEGWIFGDGEGNFTQLSNSRMNHDNEMANNYIEDPPEADYTVATGVTRFATGTADTTKTYAENQTFATGYSNDVFYQNAIPIPADTLNKKYESTAIVHWAKISHQGREESGRPTQAVMRINADSNIVFTPVVNLDCTITDDTAVQRTKQNGKENIVMDNVFRVKIEAIGTNSDENYYPGYGYDSYVRYLNKDVVDGEVVHVGYVKFPFPVIKKAVEGTNSIDTYYKQGTWIACKVGETEFIAAYTKEELEDVQISYMNRAENVLQKNEFTYVAPGTSSSSLHDADNVEDNVQKALLRGSIPDWDNISAAVTNGGSINYDGTHNVYIATLTQDCNLYGRVYGFKIIDQTDYPTWENVFRNADGTLNMNGYTSGTNNREGWLEQSSTLKTMPTVKGSNDSYANAGVLKPGYAIRYTFETIGDMYRSNDYVAITPEFYWINADGSQGGEVDVYYKENSSTNTDTALIKVGSTADQKNKKVLTLGNFNFGHNYNYYTAIQSLKSGSSGSQFSLKQDTEKDNLVHAARILGYSSVKEYLNYGEELWYPSYTKLTNKMQTYDGLAHETILSNGTKDGFSALKSAIIKYNNISGVSRDDIYKHVQEWYGEFYLPSNIYVASKGTSVAQYLSSENGFSTLTGNEACWKKNGYLAVKFNIVTYRNGEEWLMYDNTECEDGFLAYDHCDMWKREGYVTTKTDADGTKYNLKEGTVVLYQVGYPGGNDETNNGNPSAANDYTGAGTH